MSSHYPPGGPPTVHNPFEEDLNANHNPGVAHLEAPIGGRRYQLSDSHASSLQSLPNESLYSLASGEKDYDDMGYRGADDDDEHRPLTGREEYAGAGDYRPEGQSFGGAEGYGMPNPNAYLGPQGSLYQTGGQGLTRKQTSAV